MAGPFRPEGIVIEAELSEPKTYLRITPERHPGGAWLHDPEEFDHSLDREAVIDRYVLPESDGYGVATVEVPPGETLDIGTVASTDGQSGGGDLVRVQDRDSIPDDWIQETTTLESYLDAERGSSGLLSRLLGAVGMAE